MKYQITTDMEKTIKANNEDITLKIADKDGYAVAIAFVYKKNVFNVYWFDEENNTVKKSIKGVKSLEGVEEWIDSVGINLAPLMAPPMAKPGLMAYVDGNFFVNVTEVARYRKVLPVKIKNEIKNLFPNSKIEFKYE